MGHGARFEIVLELEIAFGRLAASLAPAESLGQGGQHQDGFERSESMTPGFLKFALAVLCGAVVQVAAAADLFEAEAGCLVVVATQLAEVPQEFLEALPVVVRLAGILKQGLGHADEFGSQEGGQ